MLVICISDRIFLDTHFCLSTHKQLLMLFVGLLRSTFLNLVPWTGKERTYEQIEVHTQSVSSETTALGSLNKN